MSQSDFFISAFDQPHPDRSRSISAAHPEVRLLIGRNPWTSVIGASLVAAQITSAAFMGRLGISYWWAALLFAYFFGAFANHCLYVVIHEATHRLIFKTRAANMLVAIFCDMPNVIPGAIGFVVCHLKHHAHQGDYDRDADIASRWEARLVGNCWYRKAMWLALFPIFQIARTARLKDVAVLNKWTAVNLGSVAVFDWIIVSAFGWNALIYLAASWIFSIGPHPLAGRWIQEHFTLHPTQETGSYYGPLNRMALNVGYHNEHHDFPTVPWNRLPRVRAVAPEYYAELRAVPSWLLLWLRFLFDRRYSLYSRVLRPRQ